VSRRSLWEYINNARKEYGTTVFLTTHYIDEAEHVDQVCIINQGKVACCCPPEEMKKSLLRQEIIMDADNQEGLIGELSDLGLFHKKDTHIVVPYQGMTAQEVIARLKTRLTVLNIHEPSLEDAYVEFLKKGGAAA
jgi:ABC-2 type transport system ATP-binding protein